MENSIFSAVKILWKGNIENFPKIFTEQLRGAFRTLSNILDEAIVRIVNGWKPWNIFVKHSILDVRQSPEYDSGNCSVENLQTVAPGFSLTRNIGNLNSAQNISTWPEVKTLL